MGELLLNNAICASASDRQTPSIATHNSMSPAISTSEFVMVPCGFDSDTIAFVISGGHCTQNTVGGTATFSPMIMPPAPNGDASVMPI